MTVKFKFKFQCPTCRSIIVAPDEAGGRKASCPKCTQRLKIPMPRSRAKTVLGKFWGPDAATQSTDAPDPRDFTLPSESVTTARTTKFGPFIVAGAALALLVLVAWGWRSGRFSREAVTDGDERIVEKWVRDHSDDPGSVTFTKWGPHMKAGEFKYDPYAAKREIDQVIEVAQMPRGPSQKEIPKNTVVAYPGKVLRVVYRERNRHGAYVLIDCLAFLKDGKVEITTENGGGAEWIVLQNLRYKG